MPGHGASALENLLYLMALQSAEAVDSELGEPEFAALWRRKAERTGRCLLERFWAEGRGLLADTDRKNCFSEHAQALGILTGILSDGRRDSALSALVSREGLSQASSYFSYYVMDALTRSGRADVVFSRLGYWRDYLSYGACTTFETQYANARSDCHAWSASPLYFLQSAVAGIRPASPCYGRVRVEPQPGKLKWIRAVAPTPKGNIAVDLKFKDDGACGSIALPPGLEGDFVWKGVVRPLRPGMNEFPCP